MPQIHKYVPDHLFPFTIQMIKKGNNFFQIPYQEKSKLSDQIYQILQAE